MVLKKDFWQAYLTLFFLFSGSLLSVNYCYAVKIGDISSIEGTRSNQLVGYGLIAGLQGTGDGTSSKFTVYSIANMLKKMGVALSNTDISSLQPKNIAAVMVTATLPPFAQNGQKIDVTVSSIGDAKSLQGGTLLQTPLKAANGKVYAVAQGAVSIGGYNIGGGGGGGSSRKNHATAGRVPYGAIVERSVPSRMLSHHNTVNILLDRPDFTTANNVSGAINNRFGTDTAIARNPEDIAVKLPDSYLDNPVAFISRIENIDVSMHTAAKVVLDERTGTIVIGGDVRILPVAVSQGSLSVTITNQTEVSQPLPLSKGQTVIVPKKSIKVTEQKGHFFELNQSTVAALVRALNAMDVTPRDMIAIFQAIAAAGALEAKLEII